MRRGIAVALVGLAALAGGCGTTARYVEKQSDSGIVAIPSDTNDWPNYNKREAFALIEKHVGPHYEIVKQGEVVVGQSTVNNTHANTEQVANRSNPNRYNERQASTSTTMQQDVKEYRIWYRRAAGPVVPDQPYGGGQGVPGGVTPAGGVQGGPPPGTIPSVQPGATLQNVGNPPPRWTSGAGSHTMPTVRPAGTGGADCDH